MNGMAFRVPAPNVSVTDLVVELGVNVTVEEVNEALRAASDGSMKGILNYSEAPLVSSDYNGDPASSTLDALSTMVVGGTEHFPGIYYATAKGENLAFCNKPRSSIGRS